MRQQSKGKLIVIEGGDGSGKGTQSALLKTYFEEHAIPYAYVDFPDYDSIYGKLIGKFLRGEFGTIEEVSPYLVSTIFALDRSLVKTQIETYLEEGKIVLANRYVTSNIAHQGSKFTNKEELNKFIEWIKNLEYTILEIPKEDIVIYLHVPWQIALELTRTKESRAYLKGNSEDIQEKDEKHRQESENMYKYLAETNRHWHTLDCTKNGTILSKEEIHRKIVTDLQNSAII